MKWFRFLFVFAAFALLGCSFVGCSGPGGPSGTPQIEEDAGEGQVDAAAEEDAAPSPE